MRIAYGRLIALITAGEHKSVALLCPALQDLGMDEVVKLLPPLTISESELGAGAPPIR